MRPSLNSISLATALAGSLLAQSAGVEGQVKEALHSRPIPKITVTLRGATASGNPPQVEIYTTETDEQGRFAIRNVIPGRYNITPSRTGFTTYWADPSGAIQSPGPLELQSGRTATVALQMNPTGVISGRILDLEGDPVRDANVQAMQYIYSSGKRQLNTRGSATTDDRGEYRIYNLPPGRYYLQASHQARNMVFRGAGEIRGAQPARGDVTTFFPNAREAAGAAPLQLTPGGELSSIDIRLQSETVFTVRIKMQPVPQVQAQPLPTFTLLPRANSPGAPPPYGTSYSNNYVVIPGVPLGSYMLTGTWRHTGQGELQTFARQPVDVSQDMDIDAPDFIPGFDVAGSVKFETPPPASASLNRIRIALRSDETAGYIPQPGSAVTAEGAFQLKQVLPESYELSVTAIPQGAYLKSIQLGDRQLPDLRLDFSRGAPPLTILLATDGGRIEGTVQNDAGEPQPRRRVLLIPDGAQRTREDRLKSTLTDSEGHYIFADIPPGDYRLYAWASDDPTVMDPDLRKPHEPESTSIQVAVNSTATILLKQIPLTK